MANGGYDPKKTLISALKAGGLATAGVIAADQTGLTAYLVSYLPTWASALGAVVLTSLFGALKNWLQHSALKYW